MSALLRQRPILVTGSHRSGSTWAGQMIASHPRVGYLWEPFNPKNPLPGSPVRHWFEHVAPERAGAFVDFLAPLLRFEYPWWADVRSCPGPRRFAGATVRALRAWWCRLKLCRPLLKDPIAIFSAEWLARTFPMDVLILIRHPAAFVSSVKRLGWRFNFKLILEQPLLIERYFQSFEDELRACQRVKVMHGLDIVDEAALVWRLFHHVINVYRTEHADWIFARHEDLSLQPLEEFTRLLQRLNLNMTEQVRRAIATHTGADNPADAPPKVVHQLKRNSKANIVNWQNRLTAAEIAKIRGATEDVAQHFYRDADWLPVAGHGTSQSAA